MIIKTSRFGDLQVEKNNLITFSDGLLGFEKIKSFFIVDPGDNTFILWLQSEKVPNVAFPIIEPRTFNPNYNFTLLPHELKSLELNKLTEAKIFTILTIPSDIVHMTANLKAPLVINGAKGIGKQVVLQDNKLSVNFSMYKELKQHIITISSDDGNRSRLEVSKSSQSESNENAQDSESFEINTVERRPQEKEI